LSRLSGLKTLQGCCGSYVIQIKDAVALCEFFSWLEKEAPKGQLTEVAAAEYAETVRK